MAITWERLYGDTSKFAIRAGFRDDPDGGEGATEAESLSWGALQIWVEGRNICAHQCDGETFSSAHWYLLPLLEWVADNWDPLLHEERLPNRVAATYAVASLERTAEPPPGGQAKHLDWNEQWHSWWQRHCLDAARAGGLLPSLCLRRWQDRVEVSWSGGSTAGRPPGWAFVQPPGAARLSPMDVAKPLHSLLLDASCYLLERSPTEARFLTLSAAASRLAKPSADRATWLLGLGNSFEEMRDASEWLLARIGDLTEPVRAAILGAHAGPSLVLQPFPAALMFGATSPRLSNEDRLVLLNCMAESAVTQGHQHTSDLMFEVPLDIEKPWDQADVMADIALEELDVDDAHAAVDLDTLFGRLGVHLGEITLDDDSIRAVAIGGERFRSSIFVNAGHASNQTGQGRRFTLAHELCHLLFDRGLARSVVMPSGPWAPLDVEKRANAFAAMFLMPRDKIRAFIAGSPEITGSGDLVKAVARRFDTSFTATLQHLHNLSILSESERDALLDLLGGK